MRIQCQKLINQGGWVGGREGKTSPLLWHCSLGPFSKPWGAWCEKKKKAPTGAKLGTRLAWEFACLCVVGSPLGPLWPEAGGHSPGGSLASGSWTKEHGDRSMLTMLTWRNFLRGDGEQAIESRYFGFKTNLVPYLPLTPGMFWP